MEKDLAMELGVDETMSDEPAFVSDNSNPPEEGIQFNDTQEETPADSQPESEQVEDNSASDEDKETDVSDEEQRVPYSRFESKIRELAESQQTIAQLEQQLAEARNARQETASTPTEDIEVPREWVELYGDSDASKRAFKVQMQREQQLLERATAQAIERIKAESQEENALIEQNEAIIEDQLSSLRQSVGKKMTPEIEEEVLAIVEEFSPVGDDGKYVSLFPFDKAYEIYELRNASQRNVVADQRKQVADLTGNNSEGETSDTSDSNFTRSWDNWREAL